MYKIKEILENGETLSVEFKSEFPFKKNMINWDEFLKDFTALCNILDDNKYFIIGVSDDGNIFFNYFEDINQKKLDFFNRKLDEIKNEIIEKILKSFECYYFDNDPLNNEKNIFLKNIIFDIYDIKDKQILVIKINQFPFLLRLKKGRNLKKYREKSILIRTINNDGPGCTVLDEEEKEKYRRKINITYNKFKMLSSKNTIKHIIEAYASFLYHRCKITLEHEPNTPYSNSNFFEIYSITQNNKYLDIFIYFSKYSSIQNLLENEILKKYIDILKKYQEIYIVFEEHRDFKRIISKIKIDIVIIKNNIINIANKKTKYFNTPTQFIENEIYNQIKDEIENEVFFPKKFSGVFVKPLINDKNIDILLEMKKWINLKHSPMFALIGSGGVGKTTIAQKFCSQIENDIIFIDSRDLISHLKYIKKLNTIYDFVQLFIKSQDEIQIDENYFNEELINILVDSGKLLIVIDGLDEVLLNYSDFDLNTFIETIYKNCVDNLGKTKILFTIRDTFWKKTYEDKIDSFTINGFDIDKSEKYFLQKLDNNKLVKKALNLLQTNLSNKKIFSPFILEIISLVIEDKLSEEEIKSNLVRNDIFLDKLIYYICSREVIKYPNIHNKRIDEQLEFFIKIAIKYNGEITLNQLSLIYDKNVASAYKTHTLLSLEGNILSFKFDILIEYFKILNITTVVNKNIEIINQDINDFSKKILSEENNELYKQVYLDNQDLVRIDGDIEELKILYIEMLKRIQEIEKYPYIYSFILSIILRLNPKIDKQSNTELIKEILNEEKIYIGLCLSNNHLHDKFLFNFNDMKFKYSYIDYKYFGDSSFNDKTRFCNSSIKGYYDKKYNFSEINFDTSSILSDGMKKILEVKKEDISDTNEKNRDKIINILKKFYKYAFRETSEKKLKNIDKNILKFLIKEKIIIEQYITTSEKRKEKRFKINEKYQNDIEMILSNQINNLKLIDELINKLKKK